MYCTDKRPRYGRLLLPLVLLACVGSTLQGRAEEAGLLADTSLPVELHGFVETRAGVRTQNDPHEKDGSVMEVRVQGELLTHTEWAEFKYKGDAWGDGITGKGAYDTREAWGFVRPSDFLDVKVGRQVLTWGTGDLVFLNDLFPKDWQSYFIGRDRDYLKAPSDAAKVSLFTDLANVDLVYTPKFDPDRFITGEYLSSWNTSLHRETGRDAPVDADTPDRWFDDDEIAIRVYRNINNYELAFYGYWGFWKRPAGEALSGRASFPALHVYGGSARGQVGTGIGNMEIAFYHSVDDQDGSDPCIQNSEMRYLVGYTQDLARDCNASLQYYVEQMLAYDDYKATLTDSAARDRYRQVLTLQLTKLMMNQNLELVFASYYSPSDNDAYLRPNLRYKYSDRMLLEAGVNVFLGEEQHTFFGQLESNSNIYAALRYSF